MVLKLQNGLQINYPSVNVLALTVEENENTILKMIRCRRKRIFTQKMLIKKLLKKHYIKIIETGFYHSHNVTDVLMNSITGKSSLQNNLKKQEIEFP
jgi:hypothetical protein